MSDKVQFSRLAPIDLATLDAAQQRILEYLQASKFPWAEKSGFQWRRPDGGLLGPFNVFLYSPQMARAFNIWIDAESECTCLAADVRQVVILTVGVAWQADYEVYAHAAVARSAGVGEATLAAIQAGEEPAASDAVRTAWRFTRQLVETHKVDDELYEQANAQFGARGLVDMINLIGVFLAMSALLNAFAIRAPE